ncbi:MAG: formate dehydrogenase [Hellea sp.]|nr:formate dehydrogenase [Hellea sp.]
MATLLNTIEDAQAREICRDHGDRPQELLEILHGVQAAHGHLTDAALRTIAYSLNISRAEIHGVVSFYHDYKREKGAMQTIKICRAEACQAVGANDLIAGAERHFKTKLDEKSVAVKLEATYCLGNCALGPAIMIDEDLYGRVDLDRLKAISAAHKEQSS